MPYIPQPLDTSGIVLSDRLLALTEVLAQNTHETWAQQRLAAGWTYGPRRDDTRREHPSLVPYAELSEAEKQYDRATAIETLKVAVALGCRVEPPTLLQPDERAEPRAGSETGNALEEVESSPRDLTSLLGTWQRRDPQHWAEEPDAYRRLGERLLTLGAPLLAYDVIREGVHLLPRDVRLRQLQALALARSGATQRANEILRELEAEGHADEETLGLLARTYKDLWMLSEDQAEREFFLRRSAALYEEAYRRTGGYWTGINAATLSAVLGGSDRARDLAARVREQCLQVVSSAKAEDDIYWPLATLGEAALILEDREGAIDWYARASRVAGRRFGDVASTRRNARLLLGALGGDPGAIDQALAVPRVAISAAVVDEGAEMEADRSLRALDGESIASLRERLRALDCRVAYASAASTADVVLLESVLDLDGEAHVILPHAREQNHTQAAGSWSDDRWHARREALLERVSEVLVASDERSGESADTRDYSRLLLIGLALNRAEQLETDVVPLRVRQLHGAGFDVTAEDLTEFLDRQRGSASGGSLQGEDPSGGQGVEGGSPQARQTVAMLFADAVGFSRLDDEQIPRFARHFLGAIGALASEPRYAPLVRNTWGDGLFLVFSSVGEAGRFALDLCDLVVGTDWTALGLPASLSLRVALHAGPVFRVIDPVTGLVNFLGAHVSRAARMEPITPSGLVYASQAFAALASASAVTDFRCDYVGQTALAKGYGTFPTYHVRRHRS